MVVNLQVYVNSVIHHQHCQQRYQC